MLQLRSLVSAVSTTVSSMKMLPVPCSSSVMFLTTEEKVGADGEGAKSCLFNSSVHTP